MKKIILLELVLLFMGTLFPGDNPPSGWYVQPIPVNKNIVDLCFLDTLNGWAVTDNIMLTDTTYILKTTNGGNNWLINYRTHTKYFHAIQFVDMQTGYVAGGTGLVLKTTNSGNNWFTILSSGTEFTDVFFINKDTGWLCDDYNNFGIGLLKTTNGGINWVQQMPPSYQPQKIFFLNKDTGWVKASGGGDLLYKTTNSGNYWFLQYIFNNGFNDMFFSSKDTGWALAGSTHYMKTTNGGDNWIAIPDPYPYSASSDLFFINNKIGVFTSGANKIKKTTDGGSIYLQYSPAFSTKAIQLVDSLHGWAGGTLMVATKDGGGPPVDVKKISSEVPVEYKLCQNYPNPFNPITNIKFQMLKKGNAEIKVFDITGKLIKVLLNENLNSGEYRVTFDGSNLSSGIYFYSLFAEGKRIDTKSMVLLK